jgi:hypothetical protein
MHRRGPVPFAVVIRDGDNERVFRNTDESTGKTIVATAFQR